MFLASGVGGDGVSRFLFSFLVFSFILMERKSHILQSFGVGTCLIGEGNGCISLKMGLWSGRRGSTVAIKIPPSSGRVLNGLGFRGVNMGNVALFTFPFVVGYGAV